MLAFFFPQLKQQLRGVGGSELELLCMGRGHHHAAALPKCSMSWEGSFQWRSYGGGGDTLNCAGA